MKTVSEYFGCNVFNDSVMQERLSPEVYSQLQRTVKQGRHLDLGLANSVAAAMKDWAIEKGATHFTHWFQPMTGVTAEKHDSFVVPAPGGKVLMEFSGKELIQGEPDASSFPSGGLRATFEARGYTAWDATSYAFIKDGVLCIPTAFCSYGGHALDKKTPLLRSMETLNRQALRVVKLFGNEDVTSVNVTVGAEQEYFLIDRSVFDQRKDLIYTGRTLFGARPPKGQELGDHYFGAIKPRVLAFMSELDEELWKLGILAKTEHNEAAPAQHELAPVYTTTNIAADHNQLTMELMQKIARKHGMVCLLHEKPFAGVNGSGKHNNWSVSTNTGINLLNPGDTPAENAQFLLFLCAVIQAVDDYQELLRISIASAGNDHRLGANEAPPAIVSIFLGEELTDILTAIKNDVPYGGKEKELLKVGVHTLPRFPKDTTDRNRTSPFAFTGNKFEFRMLGSSDSISECNVVLNTAVAESLRQFADELEAAADREKTLHDLIKRVVTDHSRIIFNGNGYDAAWREEAERRGLCNLVSTPDAVAHYLDPKNVDLFTSHKVYSEEEMRARCEIMYENYSKIVNIEALAMLDMVNKDILPAESRYIHELAETANAKRAVAGSVDSDYETELVRELSALESRLFAKKKELESDVVAANDCPDSAALARFTRDRIADCMAQIRVIVDELEMKTDASVWPYPSYGSILFSVK
ncbi:MAG: glutamine synthetase III [Clostridia bacterium]|nr:glutamine synthetase III [Clostridia bacterium]